MTSTNYAERGGARDPCRLFRDETKPAGGILKRQAMTPRGGLSTTASLPLREPTVAGDVAPTSGRLG